MDSLVSVSLSSLESSLRILQPLRALSTDSPDCKREQDKVSQVFVMQDVSRLLASLAALRLTISQKKEAISLRFCRMAQMKREAQG